MQVRFLIACLLKRQNIVTTESQTQLEFESRLHFLFVSRVADVGTLLLVDSWPVAQSRRAAARWTGLVCQLRGAHPLRLTVVAAFFSIDLRVN